MYPEGEWEEEYEQIINVLEEDNENIIDRIPGQQIPIGGTQH